VVANLSRGCGMNVKHAQKCVMDQSVNERESKRDSPLTEETCSILESIVPHERHSTIPLIQAGRLNGRFHQVFHLVLAARWGRANGNLCIRTVTAEARGEGGDAHLSNHKVQPLTRL
jgi:hypothetical protein